MNECLFVICITGCDTAPHRTAPHHCTAATAVFIHLSILSLSLLDTYFCDPPVFYFGNGQHALTARRLQPIDSTSTVERPGSEARCSRMSASGDAGDTPLRQVYFPTPPSQQQQQQQGRPVFHLQARPASQRGAYPAAAPLRAVDSGLGGGCGSTTTAADAAALPPPTQPRHIWEWLGCHHLWSR